MRIARLFRRRDRDELRCRGRRITGACEETAERVRVEVMTRRHFTDKSIDRRMVRITPQGNIFLKILALPNRAFGLALGERSMAMRHKQRAKKKRWDALKKKEFGRKTNHVKNAQTPEEAARKG